MLPARESHILGVQSNKANDLGDKQEGAMKNNVDSSRLGIALMMV